MPSFSRLWSACVRASRRGVPLLAIAVAAILAQTPAHAQVTWGTSGAGGSGTWDANTTANWFNGTSNVVWPTSGTAGVFAGTAGTVTISGSVTAQALTFATDGYQITGGTLGRSGTNITTNTGVSGTIASLVSGTFGLTKAGAGTLWLTGSNNYTGITRVNAGTIGFTNTAAFGTGTVTFGANGTTIRSGVSGTLANNFLIPTNNFTGTFDTNGFNNTISGTISATNVSRNFVKAGSGTLTLSASNALSGTTQVNAGGIVLANNGNFGGGRVALGDGTFVKMATSGTVTSAGIGLQVGATGTFDSSGYTTRFSQSGVLGSNIAGTKLVLVADGGTISAIGSADPTVATGSNVTLELRSGYLNLQLDPTEAQNFQITGSPLVTFRGSNFGSNAAAKFFVKEGSSGTLAPGPLAFAGFLGLGTLSGGSATLNIGTGTFSSVTTSVGDASGYNGAIRFLGPTNVIYSTLTTGTFVFGGAGQSTFFSSPRSGSEQQFILSAPVVVSEGAVLSFTMRDSLGNTVGGTASAPISGAGALSMDNTTGTLTLSGSNTFTGGISVANSTLRIGGPTSLGTGTVSLKQNGQFDLGVFSGTIPNAISFENLNAGLTLGGSVALTGNLTATYLNIRGGGIVSLSGSNNFSAENNILDLSDLAIVNVDGPDALNWLGSINGPRLLNINAYAVTGFLDGSSVYNGSSVIGTGTLSADGYQLDGLVSAVSAHHRHPLCEADVGLRRQLSVP